VGVNEAGLAPGLNTTTLNPTIPDMGLKFIDSILMILAVACGVFAAYFAGHALSAEHPGWAWMTAGVLLLVSAALSFLTIRRLRTYPRSPTALR
jgi:uncharacterized membrane protein YgdD (TMEM256/DUF423 family)